MRRWLSGAGTGDALGESVGAEQETALGAVDITTFSPGVSGDSRHVGGSGSGSGRRTDHEFFKDRLEPGSALDETDRGDGVESFGGPGANRTRYSDAGSSSRDRMSAITPGAISKCRSPAGGAMSRWCAVAVGPIPSPP
jgi:hypothetical protein